MRDHLCYQAVAIYKQNEAKAHSMFVQALQYPYEYGSPWTDAQIYSNMGMSCGNDYAKAYSYLQKAVSLGLTNPSIIKEMNWIEIHHKEVLGKKDEVIEEFNLDFNSYSRYIYLQDATKQERKHSINIKFSHNRKRISIRIHSGYLSSTIQGATLTEENPTKVDDIYMGDDPNLLFYIIYGPFENIEKITVLKRDINEKRDYFNSTCPVSKSNNEKTNKLLKDNEELSKKNELNKLLSPIELRAISDLLNGKFTDLMPGIDSEHDEQNFMDSFLEIDFSQMSKPISEQEYINTLKKLNPEIKKYLFANIINASQHFMFWPQERKLIIYLLNLNFIGAGEVMMLNCSYVLRDMLSYYGCNSYSFSKDDFFYYEMIIEEKEDYHCYIGLDMGHGNNGDFLNVFVDYETINLILSYTYSPIGSANYILKKLEEKNFFLENGNYKLSYKKEEPSFDAIREGVWFHFENIEFQYISKKEF